MGYYSAVFKFKFYIKYYYKCCAKTLILLKFNFLVFKNLTLLLFICISFYSNAQRSQYPAVMRNSYWGIQVGVIHYNFTVAQMEIGNTAQSISVPKVAANIAMFGHYFTPNFSVQMRYMRPVEWVKYKNVNGTIGNYSVVMNTGLVTGKYNIVLNKKINIVPETGFALVSRGGFKVNGNTIIKDAIIGTVVVGTALNYKLNNKIDLLATGLYVPKNNKNKQPAITAATLGFNYNMRPFSTAKVANHDAAGFTFPKHIIQIGSANNVVGYGINNFVSEGAIPIFWGGDVDIKNGFVLQYERNVFHAKKIFALSIGTHIGHYTSRKNNDGFSAISIFPVFNYHFLRSKTTDLYFTHTVAGPSLLSKIKLDNEITGRTFTFYDAMGMGGYFGVKKQLNMELRISHYRNGIIFEKNPGLKIPLSFNLGYCF